MTSNTKSKDDAHMEDRKKRFQFLSWEMIALALSLLLSGIFGFTNLKGDVQVLQNDVIENKAKTATIEQKREEDHDLLLELRGDVKYIRERVDR